MWQRWSWGLGGRGSDGVGDCVGGVACGCSDCGGGETRVAI